MCTVSVIVVACAWFVPSFLDYPADDFVWAAIQYAGGVSKYAQCVQAGSMQEETIFIGVLSKPWKSMKYFKYDNRALNRMASNLQQIFIYEFC